MPSTTHEPAPSRAKAFRPLQGALLIQRSRIRPDPHQVRRHGNADAQKELNESVKRLGILQPITVRFIGAEKGYRIIAGHRRYRAACAAELTEVPCWVQSPKAEQVLLHQIVENWQRLDMHPYDLADALARLRDANSLSQRDLAREIGKSESEVSKLLALLELAPEVQKIAREDQTGQISRRHLYAVRNLPPAEQLQTVCQAKEEGICATEVERLVRERTKSVSGDSSRRRSPGYRRFGTPQATVTLAFRKNDVTSDDILAALEDVRRQVCESVFGR